LCGELLRAGNQGLEPSQVDVFWGGSQHVTPFAARDRVRTERLAEPGDVGLQRGGCVAGRTLAPELINQQFAANNLVRSQDQQRQQRTTLQAGDLEGLAVVPDLERTEKPKFHASATLTPSTARENPWKRRDRRVKGPCKPNPSHLVVIYGDNYGKEAR
jgi:hypothetical protein